MVTMLRNRVESLVAIVAAWRLGAAATPVNPTFTDAELDYQLGDSGATVLAVSTAGPPRSECVVLGGTSSTGHRTGAGSRHPADADVLALLVHTSGSTGRPKGVMLDHGNLAAMTSMMAAAMDFRQSDHGLLILPLFHVNAICVSFLTMMQVSAQLTIMSRFQREEFVEAVRHYRPTFFSAVPTIYAHLVSAPDDVELDFSSVRVAICGAPT
ncbi:AMP-binding protein [Streptomyces canus]|uniref:class I adenylate-forming enzyme family protein n=1 Tax=Streptomyces canus TaxID=58343 RepID=UPI00371A5139